MVQQQRAHSDVIGDVTSHVTQQRGGAATALESRLVNEANGNRLASRAGRHTDREADRRPYGRRFGNAISRRVEADVCARSRRSPACSRLGD